MQASIFITGCGTGIGLRLTQRLSQLGHRVFATARRIEDLEALDAIPGVVPVRLDVRRAEEIEQAVAKVRSEEGGLQALVNNAGVGGIGPIAAWTDAELDDITAVDALGPVRMVRAFLPLLLASRGRVVNVGSRGGTISKKYFGPYTMAKHALEAFTVALADEVEPFGMRVSIVQPGGVATPIAAKSLGEDIARFRRAPEPFRAETSAIADALEGKADSSAEGPAADAPESDTNRKPLHPDLVVDAILHALFDPHPRRRYLVGTRWEGDRVLGALFERVVDANACPALSYSREELIARLDRALRDEMGRAEGRD